MANLLWLQCSLSLKLNGINLPFALVPTSRESQGKNHSWVIWKHENTQIHTDISLCVCLHTHINGILQHTLRGDPVLVFLPQILSEAGGTGAFRLKGLIQSTHGKDKHRSAPKGLWLYQIFLIPPYCTGGLWSDPVPKVSLELTLKLK